MLSHNQVWQGSDYSWGVRWLPYHPPRWDLCKGCNSEFQSRCRPRKDLWTQEAEHIRWQGTELNHLCTKSLELFLNPIQSNTTDEWQNITVTARSQPYQRTAAHCCGSLRRCQATGGRILSFQPLFLCLFVSSLLQETRQAGCSGVHGCPVCLISGGPSVPNERARFACDVGNELPLGTN